MIAEVTRDNIERYLELMLQYQRFYKVENCEMGKNRLFFENFLDKPELARMSLFMKGEEAAGFATVYFSFSSTIASRVAVLNDLFVLPKFRKQGIGKALIEDAFSQLERYKCARLQWVTSEDNLTAKSLYKSLGANESIWNFFTLYR